jgi:hypothetical protein
LHKKTGFGQRAKKENQRKDFFRRKNGRLSLDKNFGSSFSVSGRT